MELDPVPMSALGQKQTYYIPAFHIALAFKALKMCVFCERMRCAEIRLSASPAAAHRVMNSRRSIAAPRPRIEHRNASNE
jgi:hypothetical protein